MPASIPDRVLSMAAPVAAVFGDISAGAVVAAVVAAAIGYLVGMFPTASLVGRRIGRDPRREGSGNPGASNVYRLGGKLAGLVVVLGDMAKGFVPTLAVLWWGDSLVAAVAWLGAVAGHVWPVTRKFRGGKGMATMGGGALVLAPAIGLACAALFVIVVKLTRIAALGSLAAVVAYPLLVAGAGWPGPEIVVAVAASGVVVIRHRANISRLVRGREQRLRRTGPD